MTGGPRTTCRHQRATGSIFLDSCVQPKTPLAVENPPAMPRTDPPHSDWGTCRHEDNPETHPRTSFTLFSVLLLKGPSCSSGRSSHDDLHHVAAPPNTAAGTEGARARPRQHLRKSPPASPCTGQPLLTPKGLTAPKLIITRTWGEDCNCSKGEQHQQFQQQHHSRTPAIHVP